MSARCARLSGLTVLSLCLGAPLHAQLRVAELRVSVSAPVATLSLECSVLRALC